LALWNYGSQFSIYRVTSFVMATLVYVLSSRGDLVFIVNLLVWVMLFGLILWKTSRHRSIADDHAPNTEEMLNLPAHQT
jgi:hypothetical protein